MNDPLFTDPPLPVPARRPSLFERTFGYDQPSEATPSTSPAPQIPAPLPNAWVPSASSSLAPIPDESVETLPSAPPLEVEGGEGMGGGEGKPAVGDACSICMDAKKDAILIDCGHRATCINCAQLYVLNLDKWVLVASLL